MTDAPISKQFRHDLSYAVSRCPSTADMAAERSHWASVNSLRQPVSISLTQLGCRGSDESTPPIMTSVYDLMRDACGISEAEAAEHVHETRLDTVKTWSSNRRPAPSWAINQLQSLLRRIGPAGEDYAALARPKRFEL